MQPPRWTACQESQYPWEREALAYLRERLPDAEPFRAWANLEFVGDDGSINEVDLLLVSLHKIYLVEIKSRPGRVGGDVGTWTWTEGRVRTTDNPLLLANRKAKKLKDLIRRQPAMQRLRVPYVEAVVFLAHQGVRCDLPPEARHGVLLRHDAPRDAWPDVLQVLSGQSELAAGAPPSGPRVDAALARALAKALDQAGIRPTQRHRRVGDYVLGPLLPPETDLYQDWEATHAAFPSSKRRVRIYPHARASSETSRADRLRAAQREYRLLDGIAHRGILRVEAFTEHERGPALVFEHPDGVERLDFWLQRHERALDLRARLALVRQVAETLQYAHARRLYHQALTPQSVLVVPPDPSASDELPAVKLFNWQAGRHGVTRGTTPEATSRLAVDDIVKLGLAGERDGAVYLAPELYAGGVTPAPEALDVFSLGALAYRLVTGHPPAASVEALHERLRREDGGLWVSEVFDGADESLEFAIAVATDPTARDRGDVAGFLRQLDAVMRELPAPATAGAVHPLEGRVARAVADRRFLVLTVDPPHAERAERELRRRFPLRRVNLDALVVDALRDAAGKVQARWDVVLRADAAAADARDWRNLQQLVARAMPAVHAALAAGDGPALLVYPGLLRRYGQLALFETLRAACERGAAPGYVVLVPADQRQPMPTVDDAPLPVVHASEWARIPEAWLRAEAVHT